MSQEIKCPQCGSLTFYSQENPFRPFCSDRCRLIDLGDWASEKYRIAHKNSERTHDNESTADDDYSSEHEDESSN